MVDEFFIVAWKIVKICTGKGNDTTLFFIATTHIFLRKNPPFLLKELHEKFKKITMLWVCSKRMSPSQARYGRCQGLSLPILAILWRAFIDLYYFHSYNNQFLTSLYNIKCYHHSKKGKPYKIIQITNLLYSVLRDHKCRDPSNIILLLDFCNGVILLWRR